MAQSPVKLSRDTANAYRIAANGSTVIWFDRKSGTDHVYVSYNKQKALQSTFKAENGVDALIAGNKVAGFVEDYKPYVTANGSDFYTPLADTTILSPFVGVEVHEDKVFTFEPTTNANFKIYEKSNVTTAGTLITDKARMMSHSNGFVSWWDLVAHTINFRDAAGAVKNVSQVEDVKYILALGNKTIWIKDGNTPSLELATDGQNQVKVSDLMSVNAKAYFLGTDKVITNDVNGSLSVFSINATPQLVKSYPGFTVLKSRNGGVIVMDGTSNYYTLTTAGDTFNISALPGFSAFSYMDVCGENMCITFRPTNFISIIKWYKNGVYQKDLTTETDGGAINDQGFYVSEKSVAWVQSSFNKPANGGVYLYEFDGGSSGMSEKTNSAIQVNIYPNPVTNSFTIDVPGAERVDVITMLGQLVHSFVYNGTGLDVKGLEPGAYFARISTAKGETGYCKFIKQ